MYSKVVQRTVLITLLVLAYPGASVAEFIGIGVSVGFAPPPLPVYVQPPCPAPGFIWTPGYWAYSYDAGSYYWIPGTWVSAPGFGLLWTPGYWGLVGAEYVWHEGYWGPHVGFYGGINYGFGYFGSGFTGGYWRGHDFYYNRAVANVSNGNITHVYSRRMVNNNASGSRSSFNGTKGVAAHPTRRDQLAMREPHRGPTAGQRSQAASARALPSSLASVNHGHPPVAATQRPGVFHGQGVTAARFAKKPSAASFHPSLADQHQGSSSNRHTARPFAATNARTQLASVPKRGSSGPHVQREPSASHRSAPAYHLSRTHSSPPGGPRLAQPPRNAPALHRASQPAHLDRGAPPLHPRRS